MMSRRDLVVALSSVLFSPILSTTTARAQSYQSAVAQFKTDLPVVFEPDARFAADPRFVDTFLEEETPARRRFFSSLADVPVPEIQSNLDQAAYDLGIASTQDVELYVVPAAEIEQIKILRDIQPHPDDTAIEVILDIVVQSMGLEFLRQSLLDLAQGDSQFGEYVRDCADNLRIRDLDAALENVVDIMGFLVSADGIRRLAQLVSGSSARTIRRRILIALGLRVVPFVGWSFTGGCFAACVYAHRRRLVAVFSR